MNKGNVLVIGNSGVGKSTLINTVLGNDVEKTSFGTGGTTKELNIHENETVPFRLIDTIGFEPGFLKEWQAVHSVQKWSKASTKDGGEERAISLIWFCVEGTSSKLFPKTLDNLARATKMWKKVPVIVVITKSYSKPDRAKNIEMVNKAFAQMKHSVNLCAVIPVVASAFSVDDSAFAAPMGINELIEKTNELMPEGIRESEEILVKAKLNSKRVMAHSVVTAATAAAATVGAVPIPFADAALLVPIETAELNALSFAYGLSQDETSKQFMSSIVEVGTVSGVAKLVISGLKAIPGINIATSVLNAIIAGVFAFAIGEVGVFACEQIYLGKKSFEDVEWAKKLMEKYLSQLDLEDLINNILKNGGKSEDSQKVMRAIIKSIKTSKKNTKN